MGTLAAAYTIAWAVVSVYLVWLSVQNHRLARRVWELETHQAGYESRRPGDSRAA